MYGEGRDDLTIALEERIRHIAEEVFEKRTSAGLAAPVSLTESLESQRLRSQLLLIKVKEFITIPEAALLLSCSDGHIRNLVGKAKKGKAKQPIPFRDLDGVTVFRLEELLTWSEQSKAKVKGVT